MQLLAHLSWQTRLLVHLLRKRPDVFDLHIRIPRPDDSQINDCIPENPEDQLALEYTDYLQRCLDATVE